MINISTHLALYAVYHYRINDHHWLCVYRHTQDLPLCNISHTPSHHVLYYRLYTYIHPNPSLLLLLILPMQNNKPHLFVMCRKFSTRGGVLCKYSTRLHLVLYLPLNPTPHIVFSVHHLQWCFNIYISSYKCTYRLKLAYFPKDYTDQWNNKQWPLIVIMA